MTSGVRGSGEWLRRACRPGVAAAALAMGWPLLPAAEVDDESMTEDILIEEDVVEVFDVDPADVGAEIVGEPREPARPPGGLFGAGLRAIFGAIAPEPRPAGPLPLDEADDGEMPKNPRAAQLWQQRKQIRQQAKHLEQALQPALRTELEMIRQSCGSLSPEARREVFATGKAAVTQAALAFAARQMQGGPGRPAFDARKSIQESLAKAVEPLVSAGEFAAYQREQRLRGERRQQAARVAIVAKLDHRLDLNEVQRKAIEADLERSWEESWIRELDDRGVIMNNERPAPDYADACIAPHLDGLQKAEWQRWRRAAGSAVVGLHVGGAIDGQGLHQEDDWWTK